MRLRVASPSEAVTVALGQAVGRLLRPGDVVALHGELGAGKTRLTRGIAAGAGASADAVSSPTFIVMQEYRCEPGHALEVLVHADAYRLRGPDELESIGWDRIARDLRDRRGAALVIEWAERVDSALGAAAARLDVRLAHAGDDAREIILEGPDAWAARHGWTDVERLATVGERRATRCPVTGKHVAPDSPTYPFFDERARLADLGKWMSGSYTLSRDLTPEDADDIRDVNG
jgi:tRNA threonylcarbamoyladenosine biosynthesis protein TsaE